MPSRADVRPDGIRPAVQRHAVLGYHLAGPLVPKFPAPLAWPGDIDGRKQEIHQTNDAPADSRAPKAHLPDAHSAENTRQLTVVGPLVLGEVLVDSDQPEDLASRSLEVEMRVLHFKYANAEGDDFLSHLLDVIGLQL